MNQSELDLALVKSILAEYKISNAEVVLRTDATPDELIDVVEGNRIYIPCIYVLNKIGNFVSFYLFYFFVSASYILWNLIFTDQISIEELDILYKIPHCVPISAHHKWNLDDLLEKMWIYLDLTRM